ncbi:molecular chaperone [Benzoatithermus flavus]|uniref:Molecular chaperone n=1 Tax=Benzoatithermus flavus TaxID=3108223 RepID=A0ABU8XNC2_9PROT
MRPVVQAVLATLLTLPAGEAGAASLGVAPTRLEFGPGDRMVTLTLENNASAPVTVQMQTFAWRRTPATEDLEPTHDLIAVPPIVALEPNARQVVRVALRRPMQPDVERAYRLLISEVPGSDRTPGIGVRFALRLSLPVFVTPAGATPGPVWSARPGRDGGQVLTLANRGTAHLQVHRIVLRAPGRAEPAQVIDGAAYVLPGQEQTWPLGATARVQPTLQLEAETNLGPLKASLALSQS